MKNLVSGIAIALLLGAIYTAPIQAQTYDGVTPSDEPVCNVLLDENREAEGLLPVTKGLYGLCVAYCEAQDVLDDREYTYEEIDAIDGPDDQILAVYNKRKKETDPPMPCTVPLPSECPCFDQAFVDQIDGYDDESSLPTENTRCWADPGTIRREAYESTYPPGTAGTTFGREARSSLRGVSEYRCYAKTSVLREDTDGWFTRTLFFRSINGITAEQGAACAALIESAPVCN